MRVYVDSSVAGRIILQQADRLFDWGRWTAAVSSELLGVEMRRALHRIRLEHVHDDEWLVHALMALRAVEEALDQVTLDSGVLAVASMPMPTVVKTLDAIHLASALQYRGQSGEAVVFATHDRQQALGARALGFEVVGV